MTGGAAGRVPCRVWNRSWYSCSEYGFPRKSTSYLPANQVGTAVSLSPDRRTGMNFRTFRVMNTSAVMMSPS